MVNKKLDGFQIFSYIFLGVASIMIVLPFIILIASSFSDEVALIKYGYKFWPTHFSTVAYQYLWQKKELIFRAYFMTILTTVIGTGIGLTITTMYAYVISRRDFPLRNLFSFLVFFTMLFNGGLVPTYMIYTNVFDVKNTIWGQIIPSLLMNGFFVLIMRSYFENNIPNEILESARVDGANEFYTFINIVIPLSLPILATMGLFIGLNYWNDWFNGFIYITEPKLFTIQNFLNRLIQDIKMLATMGTNIGGAGQGMPTASVRMAIAVIAVIPILVIYPFFQKYFVKGITIGAVKG